jgi:serine protease
MWVWELAPTVDAVRHYLAVLILSAVLPTTPLDASGQPPVLQDRGLVAVLEQSGRPVFYRLDGSGRFPSGRLVAISNNPKASTATTDPFESSDDPRSREQWGVRSTGAPAAWKRGRGAGEVVAVLDTGLDMTHEDLRGQVLEGVDLVDGGVMDDPNGHGTHVAGIIAAVSGNKVGVSGVAPDAKILPVRVLDADGIGDHEVIASGIVWAVDHGADVLNLSLGGSEDSEVLRVAVGYAVSHGVVVVAAGGNGRLTGNRTTYPAAYPGVVAVAAGGPDGRSAMFSNTGSYIDIAAPGFAIVSTVPGGYGYLSGTSQAAPFVAAGAAILLGAGTPSGGVESQMRSTTRDVENVGPDQSTGDGFLDIAAALGEPATNPGLTPPNLVDPSLPSTPVPALPGFTLPDGATNPAVPPLPPVAPIPMRRLVLVSAPASVPYGGKFTVEISLSGCTSCKVSVRTPDGASKLRSVTGRSASFDFVARKSGTVTAYIDGAEVGSTRIAVGTRITVATVARKVSTISVSGTVYPATSKVSLQRLTSGTWTTVSSATIRSGRYSISVRGLRGLYRVVDASGSASRTFVG